MNSSTLEPVMHLKKCNMTASERNVLWISRIFVWIVILACLIPMWFVVIASVNPSNAYFSASLWPHHISWVNYRSLFKDGQFIIWVRNSLTVGLAVAIVQVFITATSAFAFARMRFIGRKYGLMSLLILQMFPSFLAIAAIYGVLSQLNMIDSLFSYFLVQLGGSAYNIWLLKGYFDSIPKDLDEAAIIDGANSWQRFTRVILPLALPMLVVIFLFTILGQVNEYILSSMILQSPQKYTMGVGLYGLISGQFAKNWGEFAAAALLSAVPVTALFMILQKWIASGLVAGSVKG